MGSFFSQLPGFFTGRRAPYRVIGEDQFSQPSASGYVVNGMEDGDSLPMRPYSIDGQEYTMDMPSGAMAPGAGEQSALAASSSPKPSTWNRLKPILRDAAMGAIDAGATPNVAGGGGYDMLRAASAAMQGKQNRDILATQMQRQAMQYQRQAEMDAQQREDRQRSRQAQDIQMQGEMQQMGDPVAANGQVNMPAMQVSSGLQTPGLAPSGPLQFPVFSEKADPSRTVSWRTADGRQITTQLHTPDQIAQQRSNAMRAAADSAFANTQRTKEMEAGIDVSKKMAMDDANLSRFGMTITGPDGKPMRMTPEQAKQYQEALKGGIELDRMQKASANPPNYEEMVDQIAPLAEKANTAANNRAKVRIKSAIASGDLAAADKIIADLSAEQRQLEVATDPRIQQAKTQVIIAGANARTAAGTPTDDGLDMMATKVLSGENFTSRNPVLVKKVYDRAAQMAKESGMTSQEAVIRSYSAKSARTAMDKLTTQASQVNAFERTAQSSINTLKTKMQQMGLDSGSPLLNKPIRQFAASMGDPKVAAFRAALAPVQSEVAKVMNSANATGVLSDSARQEMESIIRGDATVSQMMAILDTYSQDMKGRHDAYQSQIDDLRSSIGVPSSQKKDNDPLGIR